MPSVEQRTCRPHHTAFRRRLRPRGDGVSSTDDDACSALPIPQYSGMRLRQRFYRRDALDVARELIGKELRRDGVRLRITEVEAYRPGDTASHCRMGRTPRNEPMWGPPGRAYVYLCYGLHQMLNLVTNAAGDGAAVLIRSCAPLAGLDLVRRRRGGKEGPVLLTGPGKVGQALDLDTGWSGHRVYVGGGLEVHDGPPPTTLLRGPRVGIDYASPEDRGAPYRFAEASAWVSHAKTLERVEG